MQGMVFVPGVTISYILRFSVCRQMEMPELFLHKQEWQVICQDPGDFPPICSLNAMRQNSQALVLRLATNSLDRVSNWVPPAENLPYS